MRIALIGAGIVGVTTAYELACDGHEVTVHERHGSVAADTSFANAGVVAPGLVGPWAVPATRGEVLRALVGADAAPGLHGRPDLRSLTWMWRRWRAAGGERPARHRGAVQRLALYSRERLHHLTETLSLAYERSDGVLVLLREPRDLARVAPGLDLLRELGVRHALLDASGCRAVEPALHPGTALHAGVHLPDGEVGNCRQFAHLLRTHAQARGVRFRFHADVTAIVPGRRPQLRLRAADAATAPIDPTRAGFAPTRPLPPDDVAETVDAVVVCAGTGAAALLAPHGLRLPLAPVHGYSLTAPLREVDGTLDGGPRSGVLDARHQVAITRLGTRLRVAGRAELGGASNPPAAAGLDTLYRVLDDWFPGAARVSQAQRWKGARPMLPDGPPVLGASGLEGVWLNLGHGASGWALACGCARVLAEAIAARPAPLDTAVFGVDRLRA